MQMFAEGKSLSKERLCEKTGLPDTTAICEREFLKKVNFYGKLYAAGRCVSVSDVRGDAARRVGTRPRSVFRDVDYQ